MRKLIFILLLFVSTSTFGQYYTDFFRNRIESDTTSINQWLLYKGDTILWPTFMSGRDLQIKRVADPTDGTDVVNLQYLQANAQGLDSVTFISTLSTSSTFGGELSINVDNTKFDIAAGSGYVVNNYTDPENPTFTKVDWDDRIGVTPTFLATNLISFIAIDANGDIFQSATILDNDDRKDYILLGFLVHTNLANIEKVGSLHLWNKDVLAWVRDFIFSQGGRVNIDGGNAYTYNGSNLNIDKSGGEIFGTGINYSANKKNPNILSTSSQTALTFLRANRDTPLSNLVPSTTIDPNNYDPDGTGLVAVPNGFCTVQFIYYDPNSEITLIQYGQYLYDSMKKAVGSYDKDEFIEVPEVDGVLARGAIVVCQGATDLSDRTQAKFITFGAQGKLDFSIIPSYSSFGEVVELGDALSYQRQDVDIIEDAGSLYAEFEAIGGGDITYIFGQQEFILDCTTGSGAGGKARVQLTAGASPQSRQQNWVYVTPLASGAAQLQASTSEPAQSLEYSPLLRVTLPDVATFLTDNVWLSQRTTEAKAHDGKSIIHYIQDKLRSIGTTYKSGCIPSASINTGPTPDQIDFDITSGVIQQIRDQVMPALDVATDGIYVANASGLGVLENNDKLTNLAEALEDTQGDDLAGQEYNLVIFGTVNYETSQCKLWVNLPNDSYTGGFFSPDAYNDSEQTAVVTVPDELRSTAFLIARVPISSDNAGGTLFSFLNPAGKPEIISLLGNPIGVSGSGAGGAATTFPDDQFGIFNAADNTKQFSFDASAITTSTQRTYTMPDQDGTVALLSDIGGGAGLLGSTWTFIADITDSDPGAKNFKLNNATQASSTFMYINVQAESGVDMGTVLNGFRTGDRIYIQTSETSSRYHLFRVTGDPTDATTYVKIPVLSENSGVDLVAADKVSFLTYFTYPETDPVTGAVNGIVKADGAGNITQAINGVDYLSTVSSDATLTGDGTSGDPLSVVGGASFEESINQVAHGFSVDDYIYLNGGSYEKAIADNVITAAVVGVVVSVEDVDNFTFAHGGKVGSGYISGVSYFLSNTVPGGRTATPTYNIGDVVQFLGTGQPDGSILLEIDIGQEITGQAVNINVQSLSGTTPSWNMDNGIHATITMSGKTEVTVSNLLGGTSGNLTIINSASADSIKFSGATTKINRILTPNISTRYIPLSGNSETDVLSWYYDGSFLIINGSKAYE